MNAPFYPNAVVGIPNKSLFTCALVDSMVSALRGEGISEERLNAFLYEIGEAFNAAIIGTATRWMSVRDAREQAVATTRYPHITVHLSGRDGNAFVILGAVRAALKRNGVPPEELREFTRQAKSGDYDAVFRTAMEWVDVR